MSPSRWPTEMPEIHTLTAEQHARLKAEVVDWLDCGRSVIPLDRERAADAIRALYAAVGSPTPAVLFFSSPAACILAWQALRTMDRKRAKHYAPRNAPFSHQLRSQLREQLTSQPIPKQWLRLRRDAMSRIQRQIASSKGSRTWPSTWDQLSGHFDPRIDSRLGPSPRVQLEFNLRAELWAKLRLSLWRPVELQLEDWFDRPAGPLLTQRSSSQYAQQNDDTHQRERSLREIARHRSMLDEIELEIRMPGTEVVPIQLKDNIAGQVGGCMGSWWCASGVFYDFCGRLGLPYAVEQKRVLRLWLDQCRYAHWWFECGGVVFASDRPAELTVDAQGRLHNDDSPALDYGDGFRLFAIHGVRVDADIVLHPENIAVKRIENEDNVEVRRVLIALYGHERYMKDSGAALVHQDERGKLWRKKRAEDADLVMVEVTNSTPEPDGSVRSYLLRVPPNMRTASAAVAWTFGLRSREYRPSVET